MQNRNVSDEDVAAKPQTDRLVAPTGLNRITGVGITEWSAPGIGWRVTQSIILSFRARLVAAAHQSLSPDAARAEDRNVLEILSPYQTIVPMAVTEVLILIPLIWLGWIILTISILRIGGDERGDLIEVQSDVALETGRETGIGAG